MLNRALADPGTGLFADADVTLLPEATSTRAIRALGRFFGTATRDDVLLVYFSRHGKLDQSGRLHLCMQDTDSTDLLSTAVSSARINEFADASRARNVVIVLDCCHAGAFRGSDLGQTVAGPGRYVLTSCRGTQLANDATVENGTSYFTQHLVDGLLQAAADQDGDGYVTFSDLYAYVDRRLRETGKQIPQRRVDGDGDLPLAKRPVPAPAQTTATAQPPPMLDVSPPRLDLGEVPAGYVAELRVSNRGGGDLHWTYHAAEDVYRVERTQVGLLLRFGHQAGRCEGHLVIQSNGGHADIGITVTIAPGQRPGPPGGASPGPSAAGNGAAGPAPATGGPRPGKARRKILWVTAAAGVALTGGVIAALVLLSGGSGGRHPANGPNTYTASAPWRLKIENHISRNDNGCSITLTDAHSGTQILREDGLYVSSTFQIYQAGSFRWQVNNQGCQVAALPGPGTWKLPFSLDQSDAGDTDAFAAPAMVAVDVKESRVGSQCEFTLYDPADGQSLDIKTATQGKNDTVLLDPGGSKTVYLGTNGCVFRVYAAP